MQNSNVDRVRTIGRDGLHESVSPNRIKWRKKADLITQNYNAHKKKIMLSRRLVTRVALASKQYKCPLPLNNNTLPTASLNNVRLFSSSQMFRGNNNNDQQATGTIHPSTQTPVLTDLEEIDPADLPPIQVTEAVVRCDGELLKGLGHPAEFIRVTYDKPERCKYCGLTYIRVHGDHHHH